MSRSISGPLAQPPPLLIGGRSTRTLRVAAEHADLWNIPGDNALPDAVERSLMLNRYCTEIGRGPRTITRSIALSVSYDDPELTRTAAGAAIQAGFTHIALILPTPWPPQVVHRLADTIRPLLT
ncbi:hypothetical protein GCM10009789_01820 [Kribbella sancticallisti]|uniref:Luciferase-like monooxygenase n=1 Tax=Kribbella sancticallisti TaxID=460087 RepID=A0ABP4MYC5_9ACTN